MTPAEEFAATEVTDQQVIARATADNEGLRADLAQAKADIATLIVERNALQVENAAQGLQVQKHRDIAAEAVRQFNEATK